MVAGFEHLRDGSFRLAAFADQFDNGAVGDHDAARGAARQNRHRVLDPDRFTHNRLSLPAGSYKSLQVQDQRAAMGAPWT